MTKKIRECSCVTRFVSLYVCLTIYLLSSHTCMPVPHYTPVYLCFTHTHILMLVPYTKSCITDLHIVPCLSIYLSMSLMLWERETFFEWTIRQFKNVQGICSKRISDENKHSSLREFTKQEQIGSRRKNLNNF
jgi:hypothetical protein